MYYIYIQSISSVSENPDIGNVYFHISTIFLLFWKEKPWSIDVSISTFFILGYFNGHFKVAHVPKDCGLAPLL